ncbi:MAG: hypothetical protein ACKVXR_13455, partial [Planctomycetota bacterium]
MRAAAFLTAVLIPVAAFAFFGRGSAAPAYANAGLDPALAKAIAKAGKGLAEKNRAADAHDVADALEDLRAPESFVLEIRKAADAVPAIASPGAAAEQAAALRRAVADIGKLLAAAPDAEKPSFARAILTLDSSIESAHLALGHEKAADGSWTTRLDTLVKDRREKIRTVVQRAAELMPDVETGPSAHPVLRAAIGADAAGAVYAKWRNVEVHAQSATEDQVRTQLRDAIRAAAVSRFIRKGSLEPVPPRRPLVMLFLQDEAYTKAVAAAEASKALLYFDAKVAREAGFFHRKECSGFLGAPGPKIIREQLLLHLWCVQAEGEYTKGYEMQP